MSIMHKHHIIPRYEGGTDTPENIVELTVTQHAMWHFAEWQRKGNWQDNLAVRVLTGRISREEATREAVREQNRNRVWTAEMREKCGRATKKRGAKIHCPDLNRTWDCAKDAGEELGMKWKCIYRVCRREGGRTKYHGLRFNFVGTVEARQ